VKTNSVQSEIQKAGHYSRTSNMG